jgi:hypothetical protein
VLTSPSSRATHLASTLFRLAQRDSADPQSEPDTTTRSTMSTFLTCSIVGLPATRGRLTRHLVRHLVSHQDALELLQVVLMHNENGQPLSA